MLPTFPLIQQSRREQNFAAIRNFAMRISPMLRTIPGHVQFEGTGHSIERHDDSSSITEMVPVSAEVSFPKDMPLAEFTLDELQMRLIELAQQMARGTGEHFISVMDEATAAVGNVVDGGGQPLSEDLLIEAYSKMEHTFDSNGRWHEPAILGGITAEALAAIQSSPTYKRKLDALLKDKLDDFLRREADRVLAG